MTGRHWLAIGMFLTGIATVVGSLNDWHEATTPAFVAGVLLQIGGKLVALFSPSAGEVKGG